MNKRRLDQRVALLTGLTEHQVAAVTSTFLRLIANDLVRGEVVHLYNFGRLRMKSQSGRLRVLFLRDKFFRRLISDRLNGETKMEKFGVDERSGKSQEQLEKEAAQGCPMCGGKIETHGAIRMCANCGTQPFEGIPAQTSK